MKLFAFLKNETYLYVIKVIFILQAMLEWTSQAGLPLDSLIRVLSTYELLLC